MEAKNHTSIISSSKQNKFKPFTIDPVLLQRRPQLYEGLPHRLVLPLEVGLELGGLVRARLLHVLDGPVHVVRERGEDAYVVLAATERKV